MASPQLENGYFKIANEIAEKLCSYRVPGQEMQIIWAVLRKTYGFNKKEDKISYGQLSKITNINRRRAIELTQSLVQKKILGSAGNGTRQPSTIWFNKDYDTWLPSAKKDTSAKNGTRVVPKKIPVPSAEKDTHKRHSKDTIQKTYMPAKGEFENVKITEDEFGKLNEKFGEKDTQEKIENLSQYLASKGKKYKSHYATILTWARKEEKENGNSAASERDALAFLSDMGEEKETD